MDSHEPVMNQSFAQDAFTAAELTYRSEQASLPQGWKSLPPPKGMEADFKTAVCDHLVSPGGDHFIAFRGTVVTDANDWANNLGQGATAYRPQYDAAARIAEHFRDNRDQAGYDYNVTYAGHSLGGGKAQLAAEVASQKPNREGAIAEPQTCVAVNAAPVHRDTYEAYGCHPHTHTCKTLELENENDLLTVAREWTPTMAGSIAQSAHQNVAAVVHGANVVADVASGAANTIASGVASGANTIASGANTIASGVASGANAIKSGLTTGANTIASGVATGKNAIATGANIASKGATSVANTVANGASTVAGVVATATANYAPSAVYNLGSRFLSAGYNAAASLGSAGYNLASGVGATVASVANAGYEVGASGVALGKNTVASVGATAASVGNTVASTVASVGSTVASVGSSVGSTVASVGSTVGSTVGSAAVVGGAALYAAARLPDRVVSAAIERSSINEARLQSDRYNVKIAGSGAIGSRDPASGHYMTSFDKNDSKGAGNPTQISYDIKSVQAYGGLQPVQSNDLSAFDHLRPSTQRLLNVAVQANSIGQKALEMTSKSVGRE